MELYQLRAFAAVARTANLTRAAELLNLSQPALSAQIKALELGLPLFERTGRGMELTGGGRLLLARAEGITSMSEQVALFARDLSGRKAGSLRIGLNTDAGVLRIAALSSELAASPFEVDLELVQGVTSSVIDGVAGRLLDGGFVYGPFERIDIRLMELSRTRLVIVAPRAWKVRLAGAPLERVLLEPWIWPPEDCPFYRTIAPLFRHAGVASSRSVTADHEGTILRLVAAEIGVSMLPADVLRASGDRSEVVELRDSGSEIALSFIYREQSRRDPLMEQLLAALSRVWNGPPKQQQPPA